MIKKSFLAVVVLSLIMCGSSYGQFVPINPSDLPGGLTAGDGPITGVFDISAALSQPANTTSLTIANAYVSNTTDSWTVSETVTSTFIFGGQDVTAFVNHGANLGGTNQNGGDPPRDGISAASGETWTLTSSLDPGYTAGQDASDYFVDYTGNENTTQSNNSGFRWVSDQPVSSFSVFSSNTEDLNNDYTFRVRAVNAVPEPAAGMLLALGGLFALRRKRS